MEIVYYDREEFEKEFSSSESFVLKNMKPVPAGTSIFSMSDTSQNRKWKSFADKYDIHFIFLFLMVLFQRLIFMLFPNFILWQPTVMAV